MKIVFVSRVSFADNDLPILRELQKQGHEVYYYMELPSYQLRSTIIDISNQDPRPDILPFTTYPELNKFSKYVDCTNFYVINRINNHSYAKTTFGVYYKLYKIIENLNPDVIHIFFHLDIYNLLLYRFRSKMVLTVHDPFLHSGEQTLRLKFLRWIAFKVIPKFVLLNKTQEWDFENINHIDPDRVLINSITKFDFYEELAPKTTQRIRHSILFFGRISKYKGLEYLCKAFPLIKQEVEDSTLIIAGGGRIDFDITKYLSISGIELRNHYISAEQLAKYLKQVDICVCPYTDATQSGVITTSYSMGVPVVATNVGGLSEMVEDNLGGLLVEPKSPELLASAIIKLFKDDDLCCAMRNHLLHNYYIGERTTESIVKKYINFYKKQ